MHQAAQRVDRSKSPQPANSWTIPTTPAQPSSEASAVPEILSGGDYLKISRWHHERALEKTLRNRPDPLEKAELTDRDRDFLSSLKRS